MLVLVFAVGFLCHDLRSHSSFQGKQGLAGKEESTGLSLGTQLGVALPAPNTHDGANTSARSFCPQLWPYCFTWD